MLGIPVFLAVCLLSAVDGSTDEKCFPTFVPWRSNNVECKNSCGGYASYCPNVCGFAGYCCRKTYGGCPFGANEASPGSHTCVTVKDDITEAEWAKMKAEYTNCVQNPKCKGCMTTVKTYLPVLLQAGKLEGKGEVGVNYGSSDEFLSKSYMAQWAKTLDMREGDDIIYHVTDNEPVTIDGHVNGLVPAGGKRDYGGINWRMRYRPLGLYAPPGEIVTITVPEEMSGKLEVVIGITEFREYSIYNFPPMKGKVLKVASPWGGLIVLRLTEKDAIKGFFEEFQRTTFTVTVNNALRAPTFVYGTHTDDDWKNTLRKYAPKWAILSVPGQVAIYVQTLRIKHIDNMNETMSKIKNTMDLLEEMMGLPPNSKPGADIWIFNPGAGGGWRGGGNCRPGASSIGDYLYKEKKEEKYGVLAVDKDDTFFKFGASGLALHEAGHGFCYNDLPNNGNQWTAETVRRYIEYNKGMVTHDHDNMDDMDSPDLDFPLLHRMVSFRIYSYGRPCGRANFRNTPLYSGAYDNCWKWLNWIPEKAHGWDVYKKVNTLDVKLDTGDLGSSDRMMYLYCKATKHNMLPVFQLYNLRPNKNKVKETCENLPKSNLIDKWLDIVICVHSSMTSGGVDIRDCAKMPHFPMYKGLCVLSGVCQNDKANGGQTTTMKNKFDLYGSTGKYLSKKYSADNEKNCHQRAIDFFKDCKNTDGKKITATFYEKEPKKEVSYTHPPLVPWRQISHESCWSACENKGGSCPNFCGPQAYCCRKGYDKTDNCPIGAGEASPSRHTCVTKKEISEVPWRQISDEDCWSACRRQGGPCPTVCGLGGYCCRKGYGGCIWEAREVSPNGHTCVTNKKISEGLRCYGMDEGCCTVDTPCEEGDGKCNSNAECNGDLICGDNNCPLGEGDSCCQKPAWRQTNGSDCWGPCGRHGGSCPGFCGSNGYCCRRGHGGCPEGASQVSPKHHTCVIKNE